jgi:hypothetical protein
MLRDKGKNPRKRLDYPHETEGTRIAAETRARCNALTAEQRREHFEKGMAMIYGDARATKASRS